jgi:excisionase family DNA binding protein
MALPAHSTASAADALSVSEETVRAMIRDGRLPASDIGTTPDRP